MRLSHLQVLLPVHHNFWHRWINNNEIDKRLARTADWLSDHPARDLIARRALKQHRAFCDEVPERLDAIRVTSTDLHENEPNDDSGEKAQEDNPLATRVS